MYRVTILAAFLGLMPFPPARADDAPAAPSQGPYVVLVGVGEYADPAIRPRPTADADAKAVYDVFADARFSDVKPDRIALLTSKPDAARKGQEATRANILKAVHDAVARTGKDDVIVLGFFGRGAPSGDKTVIFTDDSTVKDRAKTGILGSDLGAELKPAKARKICVFMDLSFKGFDAGKETLAEPNLSDILSAVYGTSEDRDAEEIITDKIVMLSTIPANDPLTKGNNGLFASVLLDALKGKADIDGYEPDGVVTVDEVSKYLDKEVSNEARRIGTTVKEKESGPLAFGEKVSHFAVTRNPAVTPATDTRLAALAKLTTLDKAVQDEGKQLLARMPKLKLQQDLRKQYQSLADGKMTVEEFTAARNKVKESQILSPAAAEAYAKKTFDGSSALRARYIKVLNSGEQTVNAIRGLYRRCQEPVPADLDEELKAAKDLPTDKQKELLKNARLRLGKREDLDDDKDVDLSLSMMTAALEDPYTVYLDAETLKKEASRIKSEFRGIGIHIRRDLARDGLLCVSPIKGSPAYKAGLKAGDLITEIRREVDAEGRKLASDADKVISTRGMKMDTALDLILGKPGVPVTVVVDREGEKAPLPFEIKRGVVSLETVLGTKRDEKDDWEFWIDEQKSIGYIYVTQFGPTTYKDLATAILKLNRLGMKGLVLDLRFNPGGRLDAALMISDMFVEDGLLLSVRPRVGKEERYFKQGEMKLKDFPMAVLINDGSASASEIVSACLQDYSRAVVVGERSYGKGSVQTLQPFDTTGGEFKMTTARYFPPMGRNIDKRSTGGKPEDEWGVTPTDGYEVKISREEKADLAEILHDRELIQRRDLPPKKEAKAFKDKQLDKALEYLHKKIGDTAAQK